MARIVIIDDDMAMDMIVENLRSRGHDAYRIDSARQAIRDLSSVASSDLVVLDIIMPVPPGGKTTKLYGTYTAGMDLLRQIKKESPNVPVIAYSFIMDPALIDAVRCNASCSFLSKWDTRSVRELVDSIQRILGLPANPAPAQAFIVHGHNDMAKLELKNYLQNALHLPEPIILHEQPNLGRVIMQKLEDYASFSSIVFVLLTGDDLGARVDANDDLKRRARQNVIFEMGYFLGAFGRESGRVILLHAGPLELPSDISGITYIDISNGIEAAGGLIRREIANVGN